MTVHVCILSLAKVNMIFMGEFDLKSLKLQHFPHKGRQTIVYLLIIYLFLLYLFIDL